MQHKPYGLYEKYIKRPLDCLLASCALLLLSPVMLITALFVRIKLGSPVLFSQERPGKDEKIFKLYKFRSMTSEKDEKGEFLPDHLRLNSFGKLLRASSLDELPELFNIIKGDMAIVGPRPLLVRYLTAYTATERYRHCVRPGLTGLAQVSGRNYLGWNDRLALDVEYAKRITFLGDLKIVFLTISKVIKKEGIADSTEFQESYLDEERGLV